MTPGSAISRAVMSEGSQGSQLSKIAVEIEDEMRQSYLDYAMSVIIGRALPDIRDGLKPVHRRVLFAMQELGNHYNRAYKKSARVVGDVIGKYHPHGDQAVYDTLVRMAQDFSMRDLLIAGQGNFGSVDGDAPAAMRYTEVRMAKLASELLADIDKETVDFGPNYDESLEEPLVLPARFPNLIVNGASGIAVGMATSIPPHNLGEVIDATIATIEEGELPVARLRSLIPGPDYPTGGIVYGTAALSKAYGTGRGSVKVRGRAAIEGESGKERIIITELPYQVNKAHLVEKIANLVREKRLEGIRDIRDESDREGMRVVIECKRDATADVLLNQLYTQTALQSSSSFNMVAIVGGQPRTVSLNDQIIAFIKHRREVVTRRSRFELRKAWSRFDIIFGLLSAIDSIDRVIEIIRAAKDQDEAKTDLLAQSFPIGPAFAAFCERVVTFDYTPARDALSFGAVQLSEVQVAAILDMRLARLTGLERDKLQSEASQLRDPIEALQAILASDALLMQVIVDELREVQDEYATPRRTELVAHALDFSDEDLIPDEDCVVTVSHCGYVKRSQISLYQKQNRGGRGKTGASTREEDFVESLFVASTLSYVLVFTDRGKVYWLKVYRIPEAGRQSRGKAIINLLDLEPGEKVAAVLPVRDFEGDRYLVFATRNGQIKKTALGAFANPRNVGLIALVIDEDDELIQVALTGGDAQLLVGTRLGMAVRFSESDVRPMGRKTRGVRAISLKKADDAVVGMVVLEHDDDQSSDAEVQETGDDGVVDGDGDGDDVDDARGQALGWQILSVSERGYGKRSDPNEYRLQSRGGSGVINFKITDKTGNVAAVLGVKDEHEVMLVTDTGMIIRTGAGQISRTGRAASGVRIMKLGDNDTIASIAMLSEQDAQNENDGDHNEDASEAVAASEADSPEQ